MIFWELITLKNYSDELDCFLNVPDKLAAIGEFKSQVETYNKDSVKPGKFFKASSELLLFLLDSSIWTAFKSACEITGALFESVVEKFK